MPEDKDPFSEFGGKVIKKQVKSDPFSEFGGSEVPLKKKVETTLGQSPLPSALESGTSGSIVTPSASLDTPTETYTVKPEANFNPFAEAPKPVTQKTALANNLTPSNNLPAVSTVLGGKPVVADSKVLQNNVKAITDEQTKSLVDTYDVYKQQKSAEQLTKGVAPIAADDKQNTIDFYMSHLKSTDPDEYNYMIQKQEALSKDKKEHQASGQLEDVAEDNLMIEKTHAELLQKALSLKTRVMSGKYDIASNALKDNYGDLIKSLNESNAQLEQTNVKIKGIEDFLANNYTVVNGQIQTDPTNKKVAEDMLKKRAELIEEANGYNSKVEEIKGNKDFVDAVSLLDETQKTYDNLEKTYTDIKNRNPDALKGLPTYRNQILKEQKAQKIKDFTENVTGGSLGIGEGIGRGASAILSQLAFIPKSFSRDKDYGWTDKVYDVVASNIDDFDAENNPLPTGYDKPVYENGEWNLKYLPGKLAGTVVQMAPMIAITAATEGATAGLLARMGASGELGTYMGAYMGEYVAVANEFYSESKKSGMSEKDAMALSSEAARIQAVIGMISPDIKLARSLRKNAVDKYVKQIAGGVSRKEAVASSLKEFAKNYIEKMPVEVLQEMTQSAQEIYDKNEMYEKMGLNEKIQKSVKNAVVEAGVISSILTLGFVSSGVVMRGNKSQEQSLFMAASQPEEIMKAAKSMLDNGAISKEKYDDVTMKVAKANFAMNKIDKTLSAEQKSKMLIPMMQKIDLKEEASKLDDTQKELTDEKIAKLDAEIKGIVSSPSEEELEQAKDEESFFNAIKQQYEEDNKKATEIPASENAMQEEGLVELDSSQRSEPIELSVTPETTATEPTQTEEVAPLINQASKTENVATTNETPTENKEKTKEQISAEQSIADEEDTTIGTKEDDKPTLDKMQQDVDILKGYNKEAYPDKDKLKSLIEKKYMGMLERAYKAKVDGKISKPTYTAYRNELNKMMIEKLKPFAKKVATGEEGQSLRRGEAKAQVSALGQKVIESLMGKGYKNIALSSVGPISPKMIEDLVNLTVKGINYGIDIGYSTSDAVKAALTHIKTNPLYKRMLGMEGFDEKDFDNKVTSAMRKVNVEDSPIEETENTDTSSVSESNKETVGTTEKVENKEEKTATESNKETKTETVEEPKKEEPSTIKPINESDLNSGEKGERMGATRMKESTKYKEIFDRVSEESKSYEKMDLNESLKLVKEKVQEFEDAGTLGQLAEVLLSSDKKSPFPDKLNHAGLIYTMDRLNHLAESEENKVIQDELYNTAAKLSEKAMILGTEAGQTLAAMALSAQLMPTSKAGMRAFTKANVALAQKSYLNEKDRNILNDVVKDLNSLAQTEEGKQLKEIISQEAEKIASNKIDAIAEAIKGKEWVKSVSDIIKAAKEKSPENC